jgi:hypothetical protein
MASDIALVDNTFQSKPRVLSQRIQTVINQFPFWTRRAHQAQINSQSHSAALS